MPTIFSASPRVIPNALIEGATFGAGGDYADIAAVIAANLADTYVRNTDTGRLYLTTSDGYPIGADVAASGPWILVGGFSGSEDSLPAGWTLQPGNPPIYQGTYIEFVSTGFPGTSAINLALTESSSAYYFAGYAQVTTVSNDNGVGMLLRDGRYLNPCPRISDGLGGQIQSDFGGNWADQGFRVNSKSATSFQWVEGYVPDTSKPIGIMYQDHTLQAIANTLPSIDQDQFRVGIGNPNGVATLRLKHVRIYKVVA